MVYIQFVLDPNVSTRILNEYGDGNISTRSSHTITKTSFVMLSENQNMIVAYHVNEIIKKNFPTDKNLKYLRQICLLIYLHFYRTIILNPERISTENRY
jgi:hypothetical protein